MSLPDVLARVADFSRRHALLVLLAGLCLGGLSLYAAYERLGISTNTDRLFSDKLPWRQAQLVMNHDFPQFQNLLVALVQSPVPEAAEATASALAHALVADKTHFIDATQPDASPWFQRNALLFLDPNALQDLLNRTIDAQPFLGQLVADPSARGLFSALRLVAMGVERGDANVDSFAPAMRAFNDSLVRALDGHPVPLSWERLLAGSLVDQAGPFKFVLAHPKLDYLQLEAGGAATDAMRKIIAGLPDVRSGLATVRITGDVAISDEEFSTVAQGAVGGLVGSLLLVACWLFLGVRSVRLIGPILATLFLGLAITTGFAAIAVGTLNVVSVAFAVLFIGIAVDFSIQFSVRYRSERHRTPDPTHALSNAAHRVGPQILVAAVATSAGFLAFVPTAFAGVAELGLIAGAGMLIAFTCTIVFLPALVTLCRPRAEPGEVGAMWADHLERWLMPYRGIVLAVFAAGGMLGAAMLPSISFDSDPLHTKNPNTEAMRALRDMMRDPTANPYSADILEPSLAAADGIAARLRPLPLVSTVLTLSSFVPTDQAAKLPYVEDAANLLAPTLDATPSATPATPADIRDSAAATRAAIDKALPKVEPDSPLHALADDLGRLARVPDATVEAANDALVRFLPEQLDRLRLALSAKPVTVADVPASIRKGWLLPDGQARVQAVAKPEAQGSEGLHAFADEVREVAPNAVGSAVGIVESAATIIDAFRTAALAAIVAIAVLLLIALRRVVDTALVITPLLLSALLTVIPIVLVPMPLNFANIIALPLLLGVGVSFNIYFVMNWREGGTFFMGTATARAVTFSALTTATAFSSLALSAHPGTASMGDLLLTSLGFTVLTSLLFMPVLLRGLRHRRGWQPRPR